MAMCIPAVASKRRLFSPASMSPTLWLDATDSTSLTDATSIVTNWNDRSGNNRHYTTTVVNAPTRTANAINGQVAVNFPEGKFLSRTLFPIVSSDLFIVHNTSDAMIMPFSGDSDSWVYVTDNGTAPVSANSGNPGIFVNGSTSAIGTRSALRDAIINKTVIVSAINFNNTNWPSTSMFLASYSGGGWPGHWFSGLMGEVIVVPTGNREKIEGYLAHKWGVTLPVTHPYHDAPPR